MTINENPQDLIVTVRYLLMRTWLEVKNRSHQRTKWERGKKRNAWSARES